MRAWKKSWWQTRRGFFYGYFVVALCSCGQTLGSLETIITMVFSDEEGWHASNKIWKVSHCSLTQLPKDEKAITYLMKTPCCLFFFVYWLGRE
ncbi:hypothetical protein BKA57DRAFT_474648 [Linnemannia elongata]|nr:hypothetical protein BKA57DRAFT_474648 [Linnemannia elongata]